MQIGKRCSAKGPHYIHRQHPRSSEPLERAMVCQMCNQLLYTGACLAVASRSGAKPSKGYARTVLIGPSHQGTGFGSHQGREGDTLRPAPAPPPFTPPPVSPSSPAHCAPADSGRPPPSPPPLAPPSAAPPPSRRRRCLPLLQRPPARQSARQMPRQGRSGRGAHVGGAGEWCRAFAAWRSPS